MYKSIRLHNCSETIQCDQGPVIFVGPNGAGKSLLLRELAYEGEETYLDGFVSQRKIFQSFESKELNQESYEKIKKIIQSDTSNAHLDNYKFLQAAKDFKFLSEVVEGSIAPFKLSLHPFFLHYMDGKDRFKFGKSRFGEDLISDQSRSLYKILFRNDRLRQKLRKLLLDAFELFFVIDPATSYRDGKMTICFSKEEPGEDERSLSEEMIAFYQSATPFDLCSAGIQAYTSILATFIASEDLSALMVDEPEAFLHPTRAWLLGNQLSEVSFERDCNFFAATHSPDFVKGCIDNHKHVQIVRMERVNDVSRIQTVSAGKLRSLLKKPLIRSTNFLSGLFAEGVIVVEGDTDRVFYHEVYERLRKEKRMPKLLPLFINGNGKPTVFEITSALRSFGVPAVGIVDFDFLQDKSWKKGLASMSVPESMRGSLNGWHTSIFSEIKKQDPEWCEKNAKWKKEGIRALSSEYVTSFENLSGVLARFGLFIVPNGALESWLSSPEIDPKKESWFGEILEKIGSETEGQNYEEDVWKFIQDCVGWLNDPNREGMPK